MCLLPLSTSAPFMHARKTRTCLRHTLSRRSSKNLVQNIEYNYVKSIKNKFNFIKFVENKYNYVKYTENEYNYFKTIKINMNIKSFKIEYDFIKSFSTQASNLFSNLLNLICKVPMQATERSKLKTPLESKS